VHALKAVKVFEDLYGAKWPKAVAKVTDDLDVLLAFYDFPAEHGIHLRTTNPIWVFESNRRPRRCFPDWRSAWQALTLNAIDTERLSWTRSVGLAA
jgi:transposase-like protein